MEKSNRLWELLGKKTSGEADDSEEKELEDLLKDNDSNIQYMMSVLDHYWEAVQNADEAHDEPQIPRTHRGHSLRKISSGHATIPGFKFHYKRKRILLWAAVIALLLTGGWLSWQTFKTTADEMNVVSTRNGSKTKVTLPDGTQVWLNADSKLTYPNDFQHVDIREITLIGEAYFEVIHDVNRPFIIHTKYLDIKDIGTAFNIKAYPDDDQSEATLVSGSIKVSLRNNPDKSFVLNSKEKVVYYVSGNDFSVNKDNAAAHSINPLKKVAASPSIKVTPLRSMISPSGDSIITETAWLHNQLAFEGEKFSQLTRRMERWYNVKVQIKSRQVADYSFTGIFEGETLEQALNELQMIRPFKYSISKDKVLITNETDNEKPSILSN